MSAAAKLLAYCRLPYLQHPNFLAIFLFKQRDSTVGNSLTIGQGFRFRSQVVAYPFIDLPLDLVKLLVGYGSQVGEVKSKPLRLYQRTLLIDTAAQCLS